MLDPVSRRSFLHRCLAYSGTTLLGTAMPGPRSMLSQPWETRRTSQQARGPTTLREKVEQLFVVSFRGTTLDRQALLLLEQHAFGGVILYARNCRSADQVRTLLGEFQSVTRFPLSISVDQEGGRVTRIHKGVPTFPDEATYGQIGSPQRVYADAAVTAVALRGLGLTINLAPVVDVLANPKSPIGSRSFGRDPNLASRLAVAAIRGYQQNGMAAAAKHFIGLGHSTIDSHSLLPTVKLTWNQLEHSDLIPFRAAIAAGVSTVLVAHVALPAIDHIVRPASLSPVIVDGLLRRRLGFNGVIMTDSLVMGALPAGREAEAAERAFVAGADILLIAGDQNIPPALYSEAVDRIISALRHGRIPRSRLDASVSRILALKQRYPPSIIPLGQE